MYTLLLFPRLVRREGDQRGLKARKENQKRGNKELKRVPKRKSEKEKIKERKQRGNVNKSGQKKKKRREHRAAMQKENQSWREGGGRNQNLFINMWSLTLGLFPILWHCIVVFKSTTGIKRKNCYRSRLSTTCCNSVHNQLSTCVHTACF